MIGLYCPVPWPRTPNERRGLPFGDASALLFALSPSPLLLTAAPAHAGPCLRCDGERGLSMGGDEVLPALWIAPDLATGRCVPCHTFGDVAKLSGSTEPFAIDALQLWDLTPLDEDDEGDEGTAAIEKASVLTARRADAMMLPFRTSMMLRVE